MTQDALVLFRGSSGQTFLFAVGYLVAAFSPRRHALVVALGGAGKAMYSVRLLFEVVAGNAGPLTLVAALGHLAFVAAFVAFFAGARDLRRKAEIDFESARDDECSTHTNTMRTRAPQATGREKSRQDVWAAALALLALAQGAVAGCGDDASSGGAAAGGASAGGAAQSGGAAAGAGGAGGNAEGGAGGGACVSGLDQPEPGCTACQDAHCCETASAAASAPGSWTLSGAKICREANCAAECGVAEPTCGGIQPSPASCTDALYATCCNEVTACAQSDQCVAIIYLCIDDQGCAPGQAPCWDECIAAHPVGAPLFASLDDCFGTVTCP